MAVEVEVLGSGSFAGSKASVSDYTVTEDSVPTNLADSSGGVGEVRFSVLDDPSRFGSVMLMDSPVLLTDGARGGVSAVVSSLSGGEGNLSVQAESRLSALVRTISVPGFSGTLEQAFLFYLEQAGITEDIAISSEFYGIPFFSRGYEGDLWTMFKQILAFYGADISVVKTDIVIRPVRERASLNLNNAAESWGISNGRLAAAIPVNYYNLRQINNGLIYPTDGFDEARVFQVSSGGRVVETLQTDVTVSSVLSPSVVASVPEFSATGSNYSVMDRDGVAVPPELWTAEGGKVTAALGPTLDSVVITITGPRGMAERSPFRLAGIGADGQDYSSLRLYGSGVSFNQQQIVCPTGLEPGPGVEDLAPAIDAPFISTRAQAFEAALGAAGFYVAKQRSLSLTKTDVIKPDEQRSPLNGASFGDFNDYATDANMQTFGNFNSAWTGKTFADFNQYWYDLIQEDYSSQVLGNAAGSRVAHRRAIYRVRGAEISATGVRLTAEADTTFADFNESAGVGMTFADFNAKYDGLTFGEMSLVPLPNVRPEYER